MLKTSRVLIEILFDFIHCSCSEVLHVQVCFICNRNITWSFPSCFGKVTRKWWFGMLRGFYMYLCLRKEVVPLKRSMADCFAYAVEKIGALFTICKEQVRSWWTYSGRCNLGLYVYVNYFSRIISLFLFFFQEILEMFRDFHLNIELFSLKYLKYFSYLKHLKVMETMLGRTSHLLLFPNDQLP